MDAKSYSQFVLKGIINAVEIIKESAHAKKDFDKNSVTEEDPQKLEIYRGLYTMQKHDEFALHAIDTIQVINRIERWMQEPSSSKSTDFIDETRIPLRFSLFNRSKERTLLDVIIEVYEKKKKTLKDIENVCEEQINALKRIKDYNDTPAINAFYELCEKEKKLVATLFADKDANVKILVSFCKEIEQEEYGISIKNATKLSILLAVFCGLMGFNPIYGGLPLFWKMLLDTDISDMNQKYK